MRAVFGSLVVRIGAAFLLGLILLQVVIVAAILWPDGRPAIFRLVAPDDAVAMARAIEAASPAERPLIVEALNHGAMIVHLEADFTEDGGSGPRDNAPYVEKLYERYASELEGRPFEVQVRGDDASTGLFPGKVGTPGAVRLLLRLKTGDVLVIERAPVLLQRLVARFAVIGAAAAAILLAVMLFCIQQMARPARRLAQAANRLAADIDMADLPATGAAEIRMIALAFNDMKTTIRELMNERTRMLAAIAHDLRTYLTRLRLRAEFIDDATQQALAIRDLDEMALLLDDTLMFAREDTTPSSSSQPGETDLGTEIDFLVRMRQDIGETVDCDLADGDALRVRCPPLALRRMLANLTDNAIRYGKAAHLSARRIDGGIGLTVEDDGPGAPPEAFERLMKPFERLEPSRGRRTGGAGLGLAIVKALAKSQGGDLRIENRTEGGLRATIWLPAADRGLSAI